MSPTAQQSARRAAQSDGEKFLRHAADVASFYGFGPIREVARAGRAAAVLKGLKPLPRTPSFQDAVSVCAARGSAIGEPTLCYYASPSAVGLFDAARDTAEFGLQIAGPRENVSDMLVIKTAAAILAEWGTPIVRVRVNYFGDRDSRERHHREMAGYVRRHLDRLHDECRLSLSHNPISIYTCGHDACRAVAEEAPRTMNFLTEKSRAHFRDMLEQFEILGMPYELDDLLMGDEREPRVAFAFDTEHGSPVISAGGGRFDELMRRAGRRDDTLAHAGIRFSRAGMNRTLFSVAPKIEPPQLYFVQLGMRAKLKGLAVMDTLRRAQVRVRQSSDAAHLGEQLRAAEAAGMRAVIIMGQREALDDTVIVRTMKNGKQEIVPIAGLHKALKSLRI